MQSIASSVASGMAFLFLALSTSMAPVYAQDRLGLLRSIAGDIEKLKAEYPQLRDFSAAKHLIAEPPTIDYSFRTHVSEKTGGWTAGVPSPDVDGVWFYIDLHDPNSQRQIHTQPVTAPLCLGGNRVSFLILEGRDTRSIYGPIWKVLSKHGVRECAR